MTRETVRHAVRPSSLIILPVLLAALAAPSARAAVWDASCSAPAGDVPDGYGGIDIVGISSAEANGSVEVRVRYAGDPGSLVATHSLTVDFEGDDAPDLAYFDNGGGSFRGNPVYWSAYPIAEGDEIVYRLDGTDVSREGFAAASKWVVAATAVSYGGSDTVRDAASCAASSGNSSVPGPSLPLALAALAAIAVISRR